ncbi:MAG: MFS transporter [Anaerolineae bacterium]|nr:MFS transporter [Anaerolineae bacterium]MDW8099929.1 MFS transporter [Anaerolineae bacterium]
MKFPGLLAVILTRLRFPPFPKLRWSFPAALFEKEALTPPREQHNQRYLYWDIAWFGVTSGIALNFLAVYAVRLGATEIEVGALTSAPALISIFWLIPAAQIVARQRHIMKLLLWTLFTHRLGYLLIALLPWGVPISWVVPGLVALSALQAFPLGLANIGFSAMLPEAISKERLGRVISVRNALIGATSTLTVLGCGPILAALPAPLNYQVLFLIAFLASMASLYTVAQLDIPPKRRAPSAVQGLADLVEGFQHFWADRRFVFFTLASFVLHWGIYMAAPLFPVYWVHVLGASDSFISLIVTLGNGSSVLGALAMDRVLRQWGNRRVVGFSMLGLALIPILTAMTQTLPPLLVISLLGGLFAAGLNVCLFNALIQVAPDADRERFIAIFSVLANVAVFAAPLSGSWLAEIVGIAPAFFISGAIRILAGAMFLWHRSAY